jgi:cytochrome c oxidase subunit 2
VGTKIVRWLAGIAVSLMVLGCASSPRFVAVPRDLDRSKTPLQTIDVTAKDYSFTPDVIRVKSGTFLRLVLKSVEGTHGFRLGDFGIDERLDEGVEKVVEVYLPTPGEYGFRCSHFCGLGHFGMTGKIIVE